MGKVAIGIAMSLDGFVAGPNDSREQPLGEGGDQLFTWYFSGDTEIPVQNGRIVLKLSRQSADLIEHAMQTTGAMVAGRKIFDFAGAWNGHPPFAPCFIVTHTPPQEWVTEGSPFTFVTDGVESAIRQAKEAAGAKDVAVATPSIMQQCLNAGLLDEITIHLVPVLLGGGVRLFDNLDARPLPLERTMALEAPGVTHLTYRVVKEAGG